MARRFALTWVSQCPERTLVVAGSACRPARCAWCGFCMSRAILYRRLAEHARAGGSVQFSRGRWRAVTIEEPDGE